MKKEQQSRLGVRWLPAAAVIAMICIVLRCCRVTPEMILSYQPSDPFLAAVILISLYAVKPLVPLLSVSILQIAAGHFFPTWFALLVNCAGILVSVTVPYWAGRFLGPSLVGELTKRYPRFQTFLDRQQDNAWFFCFFIRVIGFLPADAVTLYIGASHTPFLPNLVAGSLGFVPGMLLATFIGSGIRDPSSPVFWISAALSAVCSGCSAIGYHIYQKRSNKNIK